ncbi:MAG: RDD family protein [Clostridia bacterium]|nr:RDD family protein [Clostridia bacterium]
MAFDLQKASMWKRISAFLFDAILLTVCAVLFAWGLSALTRYDGYSRTVSDSYKRYGQEYQVDLRISLKEYEALSPEEAQRVDEAFAALNNDEKALRAHQMMLQLSVLILSLGFFFAFFLWEFIIPLRLGDGQTVGKKIFGLGVMKTDSTRVHGPTLFIRGILGKYTIETMIPALIILMLYWGTIGVVGPIVIGLILMTEIILMVAMPTNALIHDVLAGTVVIDEASQRIFETPEEAAAFKAQAAAEAAAKTEY